MFHAGTAGGAAYAVPRAAPAVLPDEFMRGGGCFAPDATVLKADPTADGGLRRVRTDEGRAQRMEGVVAEMRKEMEEEYAEQEGAELPALPDLEALKAEIEAEERARLDPDLDTDLAGPERFV